MKSVAWLLLVGKYQNQMKILVELPGGFKKEYFKNKHTVCLQYSVLHTVCCIQCAAYSMLHTVFCAAYCVMYAVYSKYVYNMQHIIRSENCIMSKSNKILQSQMWYYPMLHRMIVVVTFNIKFRMLNVRLRLSVLCKYAEWTNSTRVISVMRNLATNRSPRWVRLYLTVEMHYHFGDLTYYMLHIMKLLRL